jgi:hypothetical protein
VAKGEETMFPFSPCIIGIGSEPVMSAAFIFRSRTRA